MGFFCGTASQKEGRNCPPGCSKVVRQNYFGELWGQPKPGQRGDIFLVCHKVPLDCIYYILMFCLSVLTFTFFTSCFYIVVTTLDPEIFGGKVDIYIFFINKLWDAETHLIYLVTLCRPGKKSACGEDSQTIGSNFCGCLK